MGPAVALGVALGLYNLLANYVIGMLDPAIHAEMAERFYRYSPWSMLVRDPIGEEIIFRLLLIGGLAWLAGRFTDDRRRIFRVALGVSAVLFGLTHIIPLTLPAGGLGVAYGGGRGDQGGRRRPGAGLGVLALGAPVFLRVPRGGQRDASGVDAAAVLMDGRAASGADPRSRADGEHVTVVIAGTSGGVGSRLLDHILPIASQFTGRFLSRSPALLSGVDAAGRA